MSKKMARVSVGADSFLYGPNPYNTESGLKAHKKYEKNRPKEIKKHKKMRAEKGYSYQDWWNFDSFIMGAVCNAMADFIEHGHGFFPLDGEQVDMTTYDYPEGTLENYNATLGAIYYALYTHLTNDDYGDGWEQRIEEATEAMILFAENIMRWWD